MTTPLSYFSLTRRGRFSCFAQLTTNFNTLCPLTFKNLTTDSTCQFNKRCLHKTLSQYSLNCLSRGGLVDKISLTLFLEVIRLNQFWVYENFKENVACSWPDKFSSHLENYSLSVVYRLSRKGHKSSHEGCSEFAR